MPLRLDDYYPSFFGWYGLVPVPAKLLTHGDRKLRRTPIEQIIST